MTLLGDLASTPIPDSNLPRLWAAQLAPSVPVWFLMLACVRLPDCMVLLEDTRFATPSVADPGSCRSSALMTHSRGSPLAPGHPSVAPRPVVEGLAEIQVRRNQWAKDEGSGSGRLRNPTEHTWSEPLLLGLMSKVSVPGGVGMALLVPKPYLIPGLPAPRPRLSSWGPYTHTPRAHPCQSQASFCSPPSFIPAPFVSPGCGCSWQKCQGLATH